VGIHFCRPTSARLEHGPPAWQGSRKAAAEKAESHLDAAVVELGRAVTALKLAHGPGHTLTLRAEEAHAALLAAIDSNRIARGVADVGVPFAKHPFGYM
jgi:hypothetical protein